MTTRHNNALQSLCPACGYHIAVPFYHGGFAPLTTLAWPTSKKEATQMEKLPLNFVTCVECSHLYNHEFTYDKVPYHTKPNRMYNQGKYWQDHLHGTQELLLRYLPENPVIVEVGAGDGHFIARLAEMTQQTGQYLAFDPNSTLEESPGSKSGKPSAIRFYSEYFNASQHMATLQPDLIIARHLLEHLENPLAFIQDMTFAAGFLEKPVHLFIEVPCIDQAVTLNRTEDFFYEHHSHFSVRSLAAMFNRAHLNPEILMTGYGNEVAYAYTSLQGNKRHQQQSQYAQQFSTRAQLADVTIQSQLDQLAAEKKSVAIWGGTGKASAFMNRYQLDAERFPVVVDSDLEKVGTYVPGTGQAILSPSYLNTHPVEVIVIATQWRAQDIALEIQERGIIATRILATSAGKLLPVSALDVTPGSIPLSSVFSPAFSTALPTPETQRNKSILPPHRFISQPRQ